MPLEWLAEALFQLGAIRSAYAGSGSVFEHSIEFAVGDGLELQNALHIHDGGAMNAHEPPWVELLRQFIERGAIKEFLSSDVQVDIHASGLYPVDIYNADETGGSAGFDHQPIPTALRQRRDGSHFHNSLSKFPKAALIESRLGAAQCTLKPFVAERFQQVIERFCLKGTEGVLIVGGDKDREGHLGSSNGLDHAQAIEFRHLDIEKHKVRMTILNRPDGCQAVGCF